MLKPYSTKLPRPVPAEFEAQFIEHGHKHCQHMFGKNPAQRYFVALGAKRLAEARREFVKRQRGRV